jgi:hypothetical protein
MKLPEPFHAYLPAPQVFESSPHTFQIGNLIAADHMKENPGMRAYV